MKKWILIAALMALGTACSSKSKVADSAPTPAPATATKAQAQTATDGPSTVQCTHKTDKRSIAVEEKGSGCEVMYTKMGATKTIASSSHSHKYCEGVATKIEKHLTSAGYTCQ